MNGIGIRTCMVIMATILMLATGCTIDAPFVHKASLDGWTLIYADHQTIHELCGFDILGCMNASKRIIVCPPNDTEVCGHELLHVVFGDFGVVKGSRGLPYKLR